MTHRFIADLKPGQRVENEVYLIRGKELRTTPDGATYIHLILRDRTGNLPARKGSTAASDLDLLPEGGYMHLTGATEVCEGTLQLIIEEMHVATLGSYDHAHYKTPASRGALKWLQRAYSAAEKRLYLHGVRSTEHLCLPSFLGLGATKAGSTWLYYNLRHHKGLYLPDIKELHYFDREFHRSMRWYSGCFRPGADKVRGEVTPCYSVLPRHRIAFVRQIVPNVRMVLLVRNPIDRSWSQALSDLVTTPNRPFEDVRDSEFHEHFESENSRKRSDYATIIENWLAFFPREQLYIGFYEDIIERPRELLESVFAHLRVSQDVDWSSFPHKSVIHKGSGIPLPGKLREYLYDLLSGKSERLQHILGDRAVRWFSSDARLSLL